MFEFFSKRAPSIDTHTPPHIENGKWMVGKSGVVVVAAAVLGYIWFSLYYRVWCLTLCLFDGPTNCDYSNYSGSQASTKSSHTIARPMTGISEGKWGVSNKGVVVLIAYTTSSFISLRGFLSSVMIAKEKNNFPAFNSF